jgi:D-alanyl-D-alanine carboxypeptidase (penicillin-binding protein 5/6)
MRALRPDSSSDMKRPPLLHTFVYGLTIFAVSGCAGTGTGSAPASEGINAVGPIYPGIGSYIVVDANDGHVALAHAADQRRPVASLTKVATALVVLGYLSRTGSDGGELMTVPVQVQLLGNSGPAGLQPGDRLSVRDGLYAAMIASDNYAAETLAAHVGGKLNPGGNPMAAFLGQMNAVAAQAGLRDTKFANAHGLDIQGQRGRSTAADMARLTIHALGVPGFSFYCSQPARRITVLRAGQSNGVNLTTTNDLLFKGGIDGVKTGTTTLAGQCLIITAPRPATVVKRPDGTTLVTPHRLIVVILGATDRFGQAWQLLNEGWNAYFNWRQAGSPPAPGATLTSQATRTP